MKFSVSAPLLRDGLHKVVGVIPSKTTYPILNNILFELTDSTLYLTGTDLEVSLRTQVPVQAETPGSITVPGKLLNDTIRMLPDVDITFSLQKDRQVLISTGSGDYHITTDDVKEYPTLPEMKIKSTIELPSDTLYRLIDKTSFAVSTGEIRSSLMGIYLHFLPHELRAVATDGHRLVKVLSKLDTLTEDHGGYIISPKAMSLFQRNRDNSETVKLGLSENYIVIELDNAVIHARLLEGIYPDYEKVIPVNNDKQMVVNRDAFASSIRRVAIYSNKITQQIKLQLFSSSIEVSAQDTDYGKSAQETVEIKYEGEEMSIGFSAAYLDDILKHIDSDDVILDFNSPTSASLIYPAEQRENEEIVMLVMPIKLNE